VAARSTKALVVADLTGSRHAPDHPYLYSNLTTPESECLSLPGAHAEAGMESTSSLMVTPSPRVELWWRFSYHGARATLSLTGVGHYPCAQAVWCVSGSSQEEV
jgi:hypothetical protein